jgi:hypothetical protein
VPYCEELKLAGRSAPAVQPDADDEQGSDVQQPMNFDFDVESLHTYHVPPKGQEGEKGSVDIGVLAGVAEETGWSRSGCLEQYMHVEKSIVDYEML